MKNNFIELTNSDNQKVLVNILNISWIIPDKNTTIIFMNFVGRNNFALPIVVKEEYSLIKQLIGL